MLCVGQYPKKKDIVLRTIFLKLMEIQLNSDEHLLTCGILMQTLSRLSSQNKKTPIGVFLF